MQAVQLMQAAQAMPAYCAPPLDAAVLRAVETALVSHPTFGDSNHIREQLAVACRRCLHTLGSALPEAGRLATLLDEAPPARQRQLLGDTVLRCAVQHAMRQLQLPDGYGLPLPQCAVLFQVAAEHLRAGLPGGPLVAHLPPMARLHDGRAMDEDDTGADTYIWHAWQEDTPYARAFLAVIKDKDGAALATPTPHERSLLRRGLRLLETLLPRLTASALSHVQLVALFPNLGTWRSKASSSPLRVHGSVFLNQELIGNPWWLAEHLLHESLHQKLHDLRHGHSLLAPDYARDDGIKICALWNAPDDDGNHDWDAHRVLAGFHAYVHLTLLCLQAEQQEAVLAPQYGPIGQHMRGSRRAIDRARYLGEQLLTTIWPELGMTGRHMTQWLLGALDALDTQRRPAGATLHLLLDLYQRQSRQLAAFLMRQPPPDGETLARQVAYELAMTREALHMLDRELPPASLAQEQHWPQARQRILQALWPLTHDATLMERAAYPQAQALIAQMVQQSSRQLAPLCALD